MSGLGWQPDGMEPGRVQEPTRVVRLRRAPRDGFGWGLIDLARVEYVSCEGLMTQRIQHQPAGRAA
jgi:hypothetical protein